VALDLKADIAVVGGGIMGCSTAYYLAKAQVGKVILIEQNALGSGSTGSCAGGFRQQFPTIAECQLAKESVDILSGLEAELDYDFKFRQGGYLILSYSEEESNKMLTQIRMQQGLGIPAAWLTTKEIVSMAPWLNADEGFVGASWCPTDGVLDPGLLTQGYAGKFAERGGIICSDTPVRCILRQGKNFVLRSDRQSIHAGFLVNCTGAYSGRFGLMLGLDIPVRAVAKEKMSTEPLPLTQPFLCNSSKHGLHFCQNSSGSYLMSCSKIDRAEADDLRITQQFAQATSAAIRQLVPGLATARVLRQWAGFYEITPDGLPLIGNAEGIDNYAQSVGFNGHGTMLAPAAARALAASIIGKTLPEWFSAFAMSRLQAQSAKYGRLPW